MIRNSKSKGQKYRCYERLGVQQQYTKEEDIITQTKFNHSGQYLGVSDKAGRIIIFCTHPSEKDKYQYKTQFSSLQPDNDKKNGRNLSEEIVCFQWLKLQGKYMKILTANKKQIKLWKIYEQSQKIVIKRAGKDLSVPEIVNLGSQLVSKQKLTFSNLHKTHIHSVSNFNNEQYFISGDQGQCLLWNYEKNRVPFIMTDLGVREKTAENMTFCKTHPIHDSIYLYGTDKGNLWQCDMRVSKSNSTLFKETSDNKEQTSRSLPVYSDGLYMKNGKYILSRDYLNVKLWDMCSPKKPLQSFAIQSELIKDYWGLFQDKLHCDNFKLSVKESPQQYMFYAGNYGSSFHICDISDSTNYRYELDKLKPIETTDKHMKSTMLNRPDFIRKSITGDFHPTKDILAVSILGTMHMYRT